MTPPPMPKRRAATSAALVLLASAALAGCSDVLSDDATSAEQAPSATPVSVRSNVSPKQDVAVD